MTVIPISTVAVLKSFILKCHDKYIPLPTDYGMFSISSNPILENKKHEAGLKVLLCPFEDNLEKTCLTMTKNSVTIYVRFPVRNLFIYEQGWWYKNELAKAMVANCCAKLTTVLGQKFPLEITQIEYLR